MFGFVGNGLMAVGDAVAVDVEDSGSVVVGGWRPGRSVLLCLLRGRGGRWCWHGRVGVCWGFMLFEGLLPVIHSVRIYLLGEVIDS